MSISFLWWNTSLSPCGKSRATDRQHKIARTMINTFTQSNVDFIGLCEVNSDDIAKIKKYCILDSYEIFDGFSIAGRSSFDTCLLYKSDRFFLNSPLNIAPSKAGNTYKVAQKLDFSCSEFDVPLHLFISHWPSRLYKHQNSADRDNLGMGLRSAIEDIFKEYKDKAYFVLLGDYNDEPFDRTLSEQLLATRDRKLVQISKNNLLYNPFWRNLSHELPYTFKEKDSHQLAGTYYYKLGNKSRWYTFDQIIFSPRFLTDAQWHLDETQTKIIDIPDYLDLVLDSKEIFDHLPVIAVIQKVV